MSAELVSRYIKYRTKRAQIKARQREELEHELTPWALDLGEAIIEQRAHGKRIEDIGFLIGLKNRTFIYKMIDAYNAAHAPEFEIPEVQEPGENLDKRYEIDYTESSANVKVYGEEEVNLFAVPFFQGVVELPEVWVTEPDRHKRKLYSQIAKEVTAHAVGVQAVR